MFYNHKNINFKSTLDKVLMHMQRINKWKKNINLYTKI
jgi:hypothetical protein